ncbi:MAG TPA: hypothetical protein VFH73_24675 [Polyangia bacterium]|jgi:hypothetical protein|nr:hypothetical protein [Polyangia bacterium]
MFLSPLCVSVQIGAPPAAMQMATTLEDSCDGILGKGSCRIVEADTPFSAGRTCWTATVTSTGAGRNAATVVLRDPTQRDGVARRAEQTVEFRPQDAAADRWAALGLLVAALVTVQQYATDVPEAVVAVPPPVPPPPTPSPAEAPRVVATLTPPPPSLLDWDLRAAALIAVGQIPGVSWGVRVETTLGRGGFAGLARFSYLPNRTGTVAGNATMGGDFKLMAPGAGACWTVPSRRRLSARLCAGGDIIFVTARGFGVAEPETTSSVSGAAWGATSASLALTSHAAVVAGIEGAAAIKRPDYTFVGGRDVYSPSPVSAAALVGLAVLY